MSCVQRDYKVCSITPTKACVAVLTKSVEHVDKVPSPPARVMRERTSIWEYVMAAVASAVFPATVVSPFSPVVDIDLLIHGSWRI